MSKKSLFIFSDKLLQYKFGGQHPFNQFRLTLTLDLLKCLDAIEETHIMAPRKATEEDLRLIHSPSFIDAVKLASIGQIDAEMAEAYGLGTEDTPIFPNMHEASSYIVGGTLTAVDAVMSGKYKHALHLGGGLHHGFKGKASGFCIYNDCAVAIQHIVNQYGAKVLYIDTDAHHGDGVQWAFYEEPSVCTLSIHETGRYLFPGTGDVLERGQGKGYQTAFNIPIDAFTEDESWLEIYETAVKEVANYFKPDVIVTQNGVDAHFYDPLTHLCGTMDIYKRIPQLAHEIAHQYCQGRWIAVGGGGYDIWRVVPRAWSLLWLEMTDQLEKVNSASLPDQWIERWKEKSPVPLPSSWTDSRDMYAPIPRKSEIIEKNRRTLEKALYPIR
ncbi:MAG TPA: acetoin utilization protein AcuC [Bacillus sp. (in: firmicutes)]|uniref:acetoin utilization protein AcuC n=1 Tax=Bacillus litorisediminis TaxID=2922713 RepID=UPI001FAE6AED|nr:acetoin utilization protein AcuC [Bacillus litorisediminis]HWO75456.1 acetoin utilization protein AcuC [Bacillus sp. (in: firmicutes)]